MACQNLQTNTPLLCGPKIHQAYEAAVGRFPQDAEFAEVFVQRHEHTLVFSSAEQDDFITGVNAPISGPNHVMSGRL